MRGLEVGREGWEGILERGCLPEWSVVIAFLPIQTWVRKCRLMSRGRASRIDFIIRRMGGVRSQKIRGGRMLWRSHMGEAEIPWQQGPRPKGIKGEVMRSSMTSEDDHHRIKRARSSPTSTSVAIVRVALGIGLTSVGHAAVWCLQLKLAKSRLSSVPAPPCPAYLAWSCSVIALLEPPPLRRWVAEVCCQGDLRLSIRSHNVLAADYLW